MFTLIKKWDSIFIRGIMTKKEKKNIPKSEKSKNTELKQQIRTLLSKIKSKDKQIDILKSELKTLNKAFHESATYIDDELATIPIEDIVRYIARKKKGKIDEISEAHKNKLDVQKEKWKCYSCNLGYLIIKPLVRHDGRYYFRSCSHCDNRTKLKSLTDDVEGIRE